MLKQKLLDFSRQKDLEERRFALAGWSKSQHQADNEYKEFATVNEDSSGKEKE